MQTVAAATPIFNDLFAESDAETQRLVLDAFDMELDPMLELPPADPTFDDELLPEAIEA